MKRKMHKDKQLIEFRMKKTIKKNIKVIKKRKCIKEREQKCIETNNLPNVGSRKPQKT